jgi:hypothetical protein
MFILDWTIPGRFACYLHLLNNDSSFYESRIKVSIKQRQAFLEVKYKSIKQCQPVLKVAYNARPICKLRTSKIKAKTNVQVTNIYKTNPDQSASNVHCSIEQFQTFLQIEYICETIPDLSSNWVHLWNNSRPFFKLSTSVKQFQTFLQVKYIYETMPTR